MGRASHLPVVLLGWASWGAVAGAGEPSAPAPFKLGIFEHQGRTLLGLVLADQTVIDIAAASAALEKSHPAWPRLEPPSDMK
ncbi:MAG TPA: hypothetical protein VLI67_02155, partial [Vicinamibacteria bacterium]|nr:hypothetical protein [Vicinamibacteria bacterium]